ncbi:MULTISPECIES: cytochrome P450 [unclassified Phenylobacterium]|uniref:cytochrome P450 n=1 Tax=unclassified Phenylobacterium TaxID=2640670 RepID=UPI0009EC01EE|nr:MULTISPECIES: cytochrome P450 [unclassified Phenylobacterium]
MSDGAIDLRAEARAKAYAMPLEDINLADPELWRTDTVWPYLERLRREDPVHLHPAHHHPDGAFWSITKYADIMAVDINHEVFSSEPSITIFDPKEDFTLPMFIAMDPPKHDVQRKTVSPIVSPANLHLMEPLIRSRITKTLDELPIGEPFDWVDRVSIELTTQMLATLFDFPWDERRKLTRWSDIATAGPESGLFVTEDYETERRTELFGCVDYFTRLWNERVNAPPKGDLISMLAHGEATRNMDRMEYLGNLLLLIIGGNDTTRNTMTGSILAMNQNPDQLRKLRENPSLIPSMVSETIRWQTPLSNMRRTATQDFELGGKLIRKGDKVLIWYASGNRDEEAIENPEAYIIDRERPRNHLSFGFGIHRCVGNRLAELQLRILWEEILPRFPEIRVLEEPRRVPSVLIRGYVSMPVVIPSRNAMLAH